MGNGLPLPIHRHPNHITFSWQTQPKFKRDSRRVYTHPPPFTSLVFNWNTNERLTPLSLTYKLSPYTPIKGLRWQLLQVEIFRKTFWGLIWNDFFFILLLFFRCWVRLVGSSERETRTVVVNSSSWQPIPQYPLCMIPSFRLITIDTQQQYKKYITGSIKSKKKYKHFTREFGRL